MATERVEERQLNMERGLIIVLTTSNPFQTETFNCPFGASPSILTWEWSFLLSKLVLLKQNGTLEYITYVFHVNVRMGTRTGHKVAKTSLQPRTYYSLTIKTLRTVYTTLVHRVHQCCAEWTEPVLRPFVFF